MGRVPTTAAGCDRALLRSAGTGAAGPAPGEQHSPAPRLGCWPALPGEALCPCPSDCISLPPTPPYRLTVTRNLPMSMLHLLKMFSK